MLIGFVKVRFSLNVTNVSVLLIVRIFILKLEMIERNMQPQFKTNGLLQVISENSRKPCLPI